MIPPSPIVPGGHNNLQNKVKSFQYNYQGKTTKLRERALFLGGGG